MASPPLSHLSPDEIRAHYRQGEAAMVIWVEHLLTQLKQQAEHIRILEERVNTLEHQRSKDSQTSSKPPSSDGYGRRTQSLRPQSARRTGGQPGHPGRTLAWVDQPDRIESHEVTQCQQCGESLRAEPTHEWSLRQVQEWEPAPLKVIEHQAQVKQCPHCQHRNEAPFPVGVNSRVQYGERFKGLMVYLLDYQLLPSERVQSLLSDLWSCSVSEGTLYQARQVCFEQLAAVEQHLCQGMQAAAVGHFDETGTRVGQQLQWFHVASNAWLTYYTCHPKRGQEAMERMNVLPQFQGVAVHDGLRSYAHFDCTHALCNAHHLRELRFIQERYQQPWAESLMTLLVDIKHQVEQAQTEGKSAFSPEQVRQFQTQYDTLIAEGLAANPLPLPDPSVTHRGRMKRSPPRNLLDRLQSHQTQVLAFMQDFRIPFDNNQAERDLRMMKLKLKISGGFRSQEGVRQFCRIRSYLSTLRKQGQNLMIALQKTFQGQPLFPTLQPE